MIAQFELDGVRTLLGPSTGPVRAGIVFRVGTADEPPARRGITHLVEHLALHPLGVAGFHYNGSTGVEHTSFHMEGSPDEVAGFINAVCASLQDLPLGRLAVEKDILRAEANGRADGVLDLMPMWRHGTVGYGGVVSPEWGLPALTEQDLRDWVARYFHRDNAVLWVAGDELPAGLRPALPGGQWQPTPAPTSALPVTPAYFCGPPGVVAWTALVPDTAAAPVFADVLERVLFRELRQEAGLSYTAGTAHRPFGAGATMITALADALPEKQDAVLGGFVDVLAAMRAGRIDPADVEAAVRRRGEALWQAEQRGDRLAEIARGIMSGRTVQQVDAAIADLAAVTAADVAAVARAAHATGLLLTPAGTTGDWAGFAAAPVTADSLVTGTKFPSLVEDGAYLVAGPEGVSLVAADGAAVTVRFAGCGIVRAWPDGLRSYVGDDGFSVAVEPSLFRKGAEAVALLDRHTPPAVRVEQPARDPAAVPRPVKQPSALRFRNVLIGVPLGIVVLILAVMAASHGIAPVGLLAALIGGFVQAGLRKRRAKRA